MLERMDIKNFMIVDACSIDFSNGMTVITGESGAGKSIIMDALELCMGKRADSHFVRAGAKQCELNVYFSLAQNAAAANFLKDNELASEDGECIIRRIIGQDNRSRAFINDTPATLQTLRSFAGTLVNIHGQHEHQQLTKPVVQRDIVDEVGKHQQHLKAVGAHYKDWQQTARELEKLQATQQDEARRELLAYQLKELGALSFDESEFESLHEEQQQLAHAEGLIDDCQRLLLSLDNDDNNGALNQIDNALMICQSIKLQTETLDKCREDFSGAHAQLSEVMQSLRRWQDSMEVNPARLQEVEQRLGAIHDMARKHHIEPKQLADHQQQLQTEFDALDNYDAALNQLKTKLASIEVDYQKAASRLSAARQKTATQLEKKIQKVMQQLAMPHSQFKISLRAFDDDKPRAHGVEQVLFEVTVNPGQAPDLLAKVASGGELSRIGLAVHTLTADVATPMTLVFDEVDVGVGGQTAAIVGQLLKQLAAHHQILCITHQPQVAAFAANHIRVEKIADKTQTRSSIVLLDEDAKVQELARMLGGVKITEQTLSHAKALLEEQD
jgi:DNA repair protein RecN (Recombination protein N)